MFFLYLSLTFVYFQQQQLLIMEMTPIVQPLITTSSHQKQSIHYFQKLFNKQAIYSRLLASNRGIQPRSLCSLHCFGAVSASF